MDSPKKGSQRGLGQRSRRRLDDRRHAADANTVDVVVVGSHEEGLLSRLFDPSVARAVTKATDRPVLVISGEPPRAA
jgi:hypothetical protein